MSDSGYGNGGEGGRPGAVTSEEALELHRRWRPGKLEIAPTKPLTTQRDLSLAYSPGVAAPCLEIAKDPSKAYDYTAKGNIVAVISNGTAVLGLGDLGALGGKPVMEGKAVLFKRFADIDGFDIEVDTKDVDEFVQAVRLIAPSFGGINLEDIKAPECFMIEERLKELCDIPVFHDDQHGTAIIAAAGLLNALDLTGRSLEHTRLVINGAGSAAIGTQRSTAPGNRAMAGITPTIVCCISSRVICLPTISGSDPNRRCQRPALMTAILGWPGLSSPAPRPCRPAAAGDRPGFPASSDRGVPGPASGWPSAFPRSS